MRADRVERALGSLWVRVPVTLVLFGAVALAVNWSAAVDALSGGRWGWFAASVGALFAALLLAGFRWHLFVASEGVEHPALRAVTAYLAGIFSNTFLPTSIGGDAARTILVGRSGRRLVRTFTSVVAARITGQLCSLGVAWAALAADPSSVPESLIAALAVATVAALGFVVVLVVLLRRRGTAPRWLPARLRAWSGDAVGVVRGYGADRALLVATFALGLVYQALTVTAVWLLAKTLQLEIAFSLLAVTVPLVVLITLIPVSIGGFGLREGGFVVLLGEAGLDATSATLLSLLSVAAVGVASLPGALALLFPRRDPAARARRALDAAPRA